jgi:hypothetical protein
MTLEIFSNMDRIQLAVGHNKLGFSDGVTEFRFTAGIFDNHGQVTVVSLCAQIMVVFWVSAQYSS